MACCCCCCSVASVVSDSVRPHRQKPTRLPRPWDSPGKNTGVGCHFLLQCRKVKSERKVAQSCPTLRPHGLQPTRLLHPWDFPGKLPKLSLRNKSPPPATVRLIYEGISCISRSVSSFWLRGIQMICESPSILGIEFWWALLSSLRQIIFPWFKWVWERRVSLKSGVGTWVYLEELKPADMSTFSSFIKHDKVNIAPLLTSLPFCSEGSPIFLKLVFIPLFVYFWLCWAFVSLAVASEVCSLLWCTGFSLQRLLLLQSTGSRHMGFSSCSLWAPMWGLSSCGPQDQLLSSMWDLPRPEIKPMSPALPSRFLSTVPSGKFQKDHLWSAVSHPKESFSSQFIVYVINATRSHSTK